MSLRQLLARIRCELSDHDHVRVVRRGARDLGSPRYTIDGCARDCGWTWTPSRW